MKETVLQNKTSGRNANIELLRILAMYMVLVLHALLQCGALEYLTGIHYYVYWGLEAACIAAVNIFVLISGYFMVKSSFKARNVVRVAIGGVWIYSVVFSLVELILSKETLTLGFLVRAVFPIITKKFWFVNAYVTLYILSPFINKLILSLTKKQMTALTVTLVALFSLRVTILPLSWGQDPSGGMGILWFVTLYCVAAWLRLYYTPDYKPGKFWLCYIASVLLLVGGKKVLLLLGFGDYAGKLYGYSSVVVLIEAVALLLAFLNSKRITGKLAGFINKTAQHSFSVYIIHFAMWGVLFTDILHLHLVIDNVLSGIGCALLACVLIFAFCVVVDMAKQTTFKAVAKIFGKTKLAGVYNRMMDQWEEIVN